LLPPFSEGQAGFSGSLIDIGVSLLLQGSGFKCTKLAGVAPFGPNE
jgi:hypothetical protein